MYDSERNWLARTVYYTCDFEAHTNLSHKQSALSVYYFMDTPVLPNMREPPKSLKMIEPEIGH